jgi:predicted NBD/HSP70 family sugar kinase
VFEEAPHQRTGRRRKATDPDPHLLSPLLVHLADGSAASRADLARVTRLARSTVSQRVDDLITAGLAVEEDTGGQSTGGRPPRTLRLNPAAGLILALDLDTTCTRVAVADLARHILDKAVLDIPISEGPQVVLSRASEALAELITRSGHATSDVRGIGVSVIGPVEHTTGKVISPPIMPGWHDCQIPEHLQQLCPAPVIVDNDVNLMALAEHRLHRRDVEHLLFIRVDTGIGCGIISHGGLHRGAQGAAGDIGHIRLHGSTAPCTCGSTGCLEAVASGAALARQLRIELAKAGHQIDNVHDVIRLAEEGDSTTRSAIHTAARHLGDVLAGIVSFFNPEVVVIGGDLAHLQEGILPGIRSRIYDQALPLATRTLQIEPSVLTDNAAIIGAILITQQHILTPEGLPDLIRHPA